MSSTKYENVDSKIEKHKNKIRKLEEIKESKFLSCMDIKIKTKVIEKLNEIENAIRTEYFEKIEIIKIVDQTSYSFELNNNMQDMRRPCVIHFKLKSSKTYIKFY